MDKLIIENYEICEYCKEYLQILDDGTTISAISKEIHDRDCPLSLKF